MLRIARWAGSSLPAAKGSLSIWITLRDALSAPRSKSPKLSGRAGTRCAASTAQRFARNRGAAIRRARLSATRKKSWIKHYLKPDGVLPDVRKAVKDAVSGLVH